MMLKDAKIDVEKMREENLLPEDGEGKFNLKYPLICNILLIFNIQFYLTNRETK